MQDWHSDFPEKIWIHNKGLKISVFLPIAIAITDDTQFSEQNYLYFNLIQ